MHRTQRFWNGLLLILALLSPAAAWDSLAAPAIQEPPVPVVQAAMFWMESCGNCHYIIDQVLPGLQTKYGLQLEIRLIELVSIAEVNLLYETADAYQIPKDQVGVPFFVIGDHVLLGSVEIPEKLPGLIETYLAQGGVSLPLVVAEGMAKISLSSETAMSPPSTRSTPLLSGFGLAAAVLAGTIGAMLYSATRLFKAAKPAQINPVWRQAASISLSLVGLAIALYLTYVETRAIPAICGPVGDCNTVQSSPYASLFGFLPVALAGVAGFLAILALLFYTRFNSGRLASLAPLGIFGFAIFGSLFSAYLTYMELFVIEAVCSWCLSTAVIMTLLMLINLEPARQVLAKR